MGQFNVAIVGATGVVGNSLTELLHERQFPTKELTLLASERSAGQRIDAGGRGIVVQDLDEFDFSGIELAFFTAGSEVSQLYTSRARAAGAIVIDNTSCYRQDAQIPLVVPEVNPSEIKRGLQSRLIANPNCSTILMVVALKPIYEAAGISRINVATYQSVSGAGTRAIKELVSQTTNILNAKEVHSTVEPVQIAFNAIPHIGDFLANGETAEEQKMEQETQRIFDNRDLQVNATCVRVPIFLGHSMAVNVETQDKLSLDQTLNLLSAAEGVTVLDQPKPGGYPTPVTSAANQDHVFVGRVREDQSHSNGINLWVVGDNIRKGAALNSIQIAEHLIQYLH